jgi:hypothetical protein
MKKLILSILMSVSLIFFLESFGDGNGGKYPSGAPAGYTGSPADGKNCTFCHGGTATTVSGWITTNIPGTGYIPGNTYIITVTVTGSVSDKKGFEVSPQKADGTLLGTITAGTGSKLVGGKYVTHSSAMTSNPSIWTFSWTAPVAGAGQVTFYGAFAESISNTYVSTTVVNESTTSVATHTEEHGFLLYPNPAKEKINLSYTLKAAGNVQIVLYDVCGNKVARLLDGRQEAGYITQNFSLDQNICKGIYFVSLVTGDTGKIIEKLVVE